MVQPIPRNKNINHYNMKTLKEYRYMHVSGITVSSVPLCSEQL